MNPFDKIATFLTSQVVEGFLKIAVPLGVLAIIGCCIGAWIANDEHSRSKFKQGIFWTGGITIVCFLAKYIIPWIQGAVS
ncbi:hypothetical protein FYW06_27810 [Bacillus paranthracis]|jgi:hypothetical protein|uniref:Uncharacterized protein n=1 Tax=Bacillus paranthracis TaxID=2026186 RepID=A0A5M9GHH7_9BACI|nr:MULTISPECIES: hypothetical protein [Bacillus cereus group]KAA8473255.1 hypothetical protein FYW06_27810 [Bacillus paranthracis]QPA42221.1 hypothetical protein INR14_29460 [Bacillus paranthracis]